jgi:anti-sigma regulatory factor (Ser/Thr protein kinase)
VGGRRGLLLIHVHTTFSTEFRNGDSIAERGVRVIQGMRAWRDPAPGGKGCTMGMRRTIPQEMEHESVELLVSPRAPSQARRWVVERGSDLPPGKLDLLLLLVSELVTNSVRHSGAVPGERVQIALERGDGTIHVDVQDAGPGFDPRDLRPGPHGLKVVESGADRWGIERSGPTTVWFELDVA